jgi:hypothetical protein
MLGCRCLDPAGRHAFDRRAAEIDQLHIRLIEDLIEVLLKRRPLHAEGMNGLRGCKYLGNGGIVDPRPRFVAPEFIGGTIGFFIQKNVAERA